MKEMTNLDIIFEMYEKPYMKKENKERGYHEITYLFIQKFGNTLFVITNFDIILYVSKKLEERTKKIKETKENNSDKVKQVFVNGKLETIK